MAERTWCAEKALAVARDAQVVGLDVFVGVADCPKCGLSQPVMVTLGSEREVCGTCETEFEPDLRFVVTQFRLWNNGALEVERNSDKATEQWKRLKGRAEEKQGAV